MVELGKSKVPLEEDLIKKKVEFIQTWVEWSAKNQEQVGSSVSRSGAGSTTIFTVPDKKTFFLTSLELSCTQDATGTGAAQCLVGSTRITLAIITTRIDPQIISISKNFSMPIRLESGEVISLQNQQAGQHSSSSIQGFLIDKRIS